MTFVSGKSPWNKGIKYNQEQKKNIILANQSVDKRKRQSVSISNRIDKLGYRYTDEQKRQISETLKKKGIRPIKPAKLYGKDNGFYGKKHSDVTKKIISQKKTGFKDSIETRVKKSNSQKLRFKDKVRKSNVLPNIRKTLEWRIWREFIFERDSYTCQECGDKNTYLEPHHIIPIRELISRAFDINNGIALCRRCHCKTFRKEKLFEDKYFQIVNKA